MLVVIKKLLQEIINNIDSGTCDISQEESVEVIELLNKLSNKKQRLSKYAACEYLNISRATFDNYVKEGKIPKGKHELGFKELVWYKDELPHRSL